jgi:hypothetical protein
MGVRSVPPHWHRFFSWGCSEARAFSREFLPRPSAQALSSYSLFWLAAGLTAPAVGSTGEAKEALGFLAIPGAGLCLLGIVGTIVSVLRQLIAAPSDSD